MTLACTIIVPVKDTGAGPSHCGIETLVHAGSEMDDAKIVYPATLD